MKSQIQPYQKPIYLETKLFDHEAFSNRLYNARLDALMTTY